MNELSKQELLERSTVFCLLPWTHVSVLPDGRVLPCCNADGDLPVGNLRESTLEHVWNSEALRRIRINMLMGKPSSECGKCYELEENHLHSLRLQANEWFSHHFPSVLTTQPEGTVGKLNLPYMDIKFSNLCNFRCRYCIPLNSSGWGAEGSGKSQDVRLGVLTPTQDPGDLWRQIEPLIPHLEQIYFSGGEPLLMEQNYAILKVMLKKDLRHVRLRYNTNFSVTSHNGDDIMKMWHEFDYVEINASLDAMGKRGEYIRKGQVWDLVLKNREKMFSLCPKAVFRVTPTLSVLNVMHFPDFYLDWLNRGYIKVNDAPPNCVLEPSEYRIQVLPRKLKQLVTESYERCIGEIGRLFGEEGNYAMDCFRRTLEFMWAQDLSSQVNKLREQTRKLDRLRGESVEDVFPELAELFCESEPQ